MLRLLLYCTKSKPLLYKGITAYTRSVEYVLDKEQYLFGKIETLNGKIVAECDFEVEEIKYEYEWKGYEDVSYFTNNVSREELEKKSCLENKDLRNYLRLKPLCCVKGKNGYAIHIKNLKERVMKLSDVYTYDTSYNNMFGWLAEENEKYIPLNKAPQNMCRVWVYENGEWVMYILISVRPEWICLELNGKKTIELRKKVLKEMIKNA